ncbi:uncharacterized protein C4orf54-like [Cyprinodon tularosa]|uniref:uncharacterized protein C4orf54-like n=1 Tax=Cyprinodon tularosa TaxID=77115 RepID=UPI0018E26C9D|nr:uncharacterized protein C4orf54-like [Cyprinodon tularosa]
MEAAEKTLTYRDDTGLHSNKLLKPIKKEDTRGQDTEKNSDESNYVDLDMRPDGLKTVKVTFTGKGNQLSVSKGDSSKQDENKSTSTESLLDTPTQLPTADPESESEKQEFDSSDCSESGELRYTDMCLNGRSDSELSESHYITTHEIQLTELDHDVDYDLGRGTRWEFEDGNLVYAFVDYASFESDETQEGTLILEGGRSQAKPQSNLSGAAVSTEQEESDLCASSDESLCRTQSEQSAGKIHLSIKASSRTLNDPADVFDNNAQWLSPKHIGDGSHFSFVNPGARAGPLCDRGQYFIPAPGRQHLATKLRRKDINEYSSGASSSISELDDADKEVRNLTAKSFRSLACPYFDAINLSTSSESSMSEYGLNKWSTYVDWNYGNITHNTSSATLAMNKTVDSRANNRCKTGIKDKQTRICALNKRITSQQTSTGRKFQMKEQSAQQGVTLNFHCNVESRTPMSPKCFQKDRPNEVLARSGCEMQYHHTDGSGDTHKRAIFASSLLKNVISKKMQFEQERKMERGEISDTHPSVSSCIQIKDLEGGKERSESRGLQGRTSELGFTGNSPTDHRPSSCGPAEDSKGDKKTTDCSVEHQEAPQEPQISKEGEPASVKYSQNTAREDLDSSSVLTKLLFVPNCQLLSKDGSLAEDLNPHTPNTGAKSCGKELQKVDDTNTEGKEKNERLGKPPEIKICLRNVKETKGCTLNIANLLTPKISYNVNKFRAGDNGRCHVLSSADKAPSFTVRNIRDTKCKFQTPIYHVRDVRKLVKSSYRFVSLDRSDQGCSTVAEENTKVEPDKPSPMVIKCNSVKTNIKSETGDTAQAQVEADTHSETSSRIPTVVTKQGNPDLSEMQQNPETKLGKQRQDRFTGETNERRNDPAMPKQDALEKLKAAVKTMEQLYVFDRNEWKRKTQASQPAADSHVLPLLTKQEQRPPADLEVKNGGRIPPFLTTSKDTQKKQSLNIIHVPYDHDTFKTQSQQSKTFTNKSALYFGNKKNVSINSQDSALQTSALKSSKTSTMNRVSVKMVEQDKEKTNSTDPTNTKGCSDPENYLTIPRCTNETKLHNQKCVSIEGDSSFSRDNPGDTKVPEKKRSPVTVDCPSATIYHLPTVATSPQKQQQVLCFSPSIQNMSPTQSGGEAITQTQRKMLLDPTTGHYYLVDTPIQATKRLFDPETGKYVDVPMPHSPVAQVTPMHFPLPPLALTPTYMVYPGFISPTLAAEAVMPQSPCHSEDAAGEGIKNNPLSHGAEKAYYSATAEAQQRPLHSPLSLGHVTTKGGTASSNRKPLISITTQQGPRIIAPPSFDGKTMSFVVEHR